MISQVPISLDYVLYGLTAAFLLILWLNDQSEKLPENLPWVGGYSTAVGRRIAPYFALFRGRQSLEDSYYQFGKKNRASILPGFFAHHVALPPSWIPWLLNQPEHAISADEALVDVVEGKWTWLIPTVTENPVHTGIIKRDMKAHLGELIPVIADEIDKAFQDVWGTDEVAFRRLNLAQTLRKILCRVITRSLVGSPLCENPVFLENVSSLVDDVPGIGLLIKCFPDAFRSIMARILICINRYHYSRCAKLAIPFFQDRVEMVELDAEAPPNDFATWAIRDALSRKDQSEKTPDMLTRRLVMVTFAALHTSGMITSSLLMDLVSEPTVKDGILDAIRQESQDVEKCYGPIWTKARVTGLVRLDRALRETLRYSGISAKAFIRMVAAPEGVRLPDGTLLAKGTRVAVSGYSIHRDEEIYPEPERYNPERWAPAVDDKGMPSGPAKSSVMTDTTFNIWGHGAHACPGRFFAADIIKTVVSYILVHYEIKPLPERPSQWWIGDHQVPSRNVCIDVRRRRV